MRNSVCGIPPSSPALLSACRLGRAIAAYEQAASKVRTVPAQHWRWVFGPLHSRGASLFSRSVAEVEVCICDVEDGAIAPGDVCIDCTLSIAWSLVSDGCAPVIRGTCTHR